MGQNSSSGSLAADIPIPSPPLHQILPPALVYNVTDGEPFQPILQSSALIGSSSEREKLQNEIAQALEESQKIDREADMKAEENKEKREIQQRRRSRVPPEPSLSEDHIVMSVEHPTLGIKRRVFPATIQMSTVYDWIGSVSDDLMHFQLVGRDSVTIFEDSPASQFSNQTLLVIETEEAPQESNSDYLSALMSLRETEIEKFTQHDHPPTILTVSRDQIFDDMLALFKKRTTTNHLVSIIFKGEDASGDGVTTDAFTSFFEKLYELMDGNNQKNPIY